MKKTSGGAGDIWNSPQAAQILKNKSALLAIMNSPEGKKLQQILTNQSGEGSLQNAAQSAAQGDISAAADLLNSIKSNPEGAALLEQIAKQFSK